MNAYEQIEVFGLVGDHAEFAIPDDDALRAGAADAAFDGICGATENTNGRVRRYLPRTTGPAGSVDVVLPDVIDRLGMTPRRCLGYGTPHEAVGDELRALQHDQT